MADFAARRTTMVDTQVRPSDVTKFPIIEAMLSVPRENFVPDSKREAAYVGECVEFGDGRALLEPRTLAKMLDAINVQPDELVLDVACGLGYSSAVLSHLAEAVVALESDTDMKAEAERLLGEYGADNTAVVQGALVEGSNRHGPYDAIIIEGCVEEVPRVLCDQLKDGGRMVAIFLENGLGYCRIGHKSGKKMAWRYAFNANGPLLAGFEKQRNFVL